MLARLLPSQTRAIGSLPWGAWPGDGGSTWSGVTVTPESSLQLLTVYGCVRLISDSISTLPVDVYRRAPDGSRVEVVPPVWVERPTVNLDFESWCGQVLASLLLHGNAYLWVTRTATSEIVEVIPMDPTRVSVRRIDGRKVFIVNGRPAEGEIRHITGLMLPGADIGMSPVEYARHSIGLGISAQSYGANFFDGEGNMPGVIEIPGAAQPGTMESLAKQWKAKRSRRNRGLPGVLQGGATWKPSGVSNEAAQFLQTRQYTAAEIAAQMFLVDPSDLGIPVSGTSLTYANLAERNLRRVQVTLLPWIVRIERAVSLLLSPGYVKLNVEGLLRGDTLTRYQTYQIAAPLGILTVDEMRAFEDLTPLSPADKKQSRSWQQVGLPALVDGGLMTVNEARAQLGLPPIPGGDVPRDPADLGGGNAAA